MISVILAATLAASPIHADTGGVRVERVGDEVISTGASEFNPLLSPDGRTLYFVRSAANFTGQKIMVSHRTRAGWSEPARIGFSDDRYADSDPTLSADGRTMYFVSNRPISGDSAKRDMDVWMSHQRGGEWGAPVHVEGINSAASEFGPEVAGGWLYFNSTRPGGLGQSDVYRARILRGGMGTVERLDAPFNGPGYDADAVLSRDGRMMVWSSWNREGGAGKGDLYVSWRTAAGWSAPVSLGPAVNTAGFELTPWLSRDGWLYFATDGAVGGEPGRGAADVYRVRVRDLDALRPPR
jgi:Tol biopolymer transport system component